MDSRFQIKFRDKKTKARVGVLQTKKGPIESPFFMPVATKGSVKFVDSAKLNEIGIKAVISNAFMLFVRPGDSLIKKFGGIGKFMNFSGINVTDSGGFQMYTESIYISSDKKGVFFRNPLSGEKIFVTPEKNMEIQLNIGAEIAMCLDRMPLYKDSKEEILNAVELTSEWARRCKIHHERLQRKVKLNKRQILFGIIQGGVFKDLREKSAKELLNLNLDGYAIGGLALPDECYEGDREKIKKYEYKAIEVCKNILPENKIVYLMGEGDPIEVLEAISRGIDMFDSKYPTQIARRGTILTSKGKVKILNKKYSRDKRPVDEKCDCFVCKNYSRAYVRHLLKEKEGVGKELASYHNLYFMQRLFDNAKKAIEKGKFLEFKKKIESCYS